MIRQRFFRYIPVTSFANSALYCMAMDLNNVGRYHESDSLYLALNLTNRNNAFEEAVALFEEVISTHYQECIFSKIGGPIQ